MLLRLDSTVPDADIPGLVDRLHEQFGERAAVVRTSRERGLRLTTDPGAAVAALGEGLSVPVPVPAGRPYILASRDFQPADTVVEVGGVSFGGERIGLIAGPCSVEAEGQIEAAAAVVAASGCRLMRAGAFKPRTSPWDFQGMGEPGLRLMRTAADRHGLGVVTEVMSPEDVPLVSEYADMLQVGSRNAQNFPLLRAVGRAQRPVLLKRGMASTIDELLGAADYVLSEGNPNVVLCERGIRGFDRATRNVLDVVAVPLLARLTHLPVIVDPSHAAGRADLVPAAALAAVAAGCDGLLVEMHPRPEGALSDADQALEPVAWSDLVTRLTAVAAAVGRGI